jgi:hypothetical protein
MYKIKREGRNYQPHTLSRGRGDGDMYAAAPNNPDTGQDLARELLFYATKKK